MVLPFCLRKQVKGLNQGSKIAGQEASSIKILYIIAENTKTRSIFQLLLLAICAWLYLGGFMPPPGPDWVVIGVMCVLVLIHICAKIHSVAGATKGDVMHMLVLSKDQIVYIQNLAITLGISMLILAVSVASHWLNDIQLKEWQQVIAIALGIGTFLAVQLAISNYRRAIVAISLIVFSVWVSSLVALHEAVTTKEAAYDGLAYTPGFFSWHLCLVLPMSLALLLHVLHQRRWWWSSALAVVTIVCLLATAVNSSWAILLGSIASFTFIVIFFVQRTRRRMCFTGATVAIMIMTLLCIVWVGIFTITALHHSENIQDVTMDEKGKIFALHIFKQHKFFYMGKDISSASRVYQNRIVWHYTLERGKPWGSAMRDLSGPDIDEEFIRFALKRDSIPPFTTNFYAHNYFSAVLLLYGPIGLTLLLIFWLAVVRAGLHSCILALRAEDLQSAFLATSILGSLISMFVYWSTTSSGPFITHWYSFLTVGFVLAMERILSDERQPGKDIAFP